MNRLLQVTVYTGQQLVLEALQRWLQRPCTEPEGQRQHRASIKSLIVLLLKTAATGVLATILDAAIEYRRRQLLAAAEQDPSADAEASSTSSRFGGLSLGPLSRAGIAAWKAKLLIAIDEMERQAHQYGIEPTRRFTPISAAAAGDETVDAAAGKDSKLEDVAAAAAAATLPNGSEDGETVNDEAVALSATVEQLQQLAKLDGEEAERRFEDRLDSLLDSLLGGSPPAEDAVPSPSTSVIEGTAPLKHSASISRLVGLIKSPSMAATDQSTSPPDSPASSAEGHPVCHICMDRAVGVQVAGCSHDLCFTCARRLCATQDHSLPQCPFCRQPINGFSAYAAPVSTTD